MTDQATVGKNSRFLLHLRLIAKIALIVGAASCLGMVLALSFITDKSGSSYGDIIRSYSLSRQNLGPTLLIAGLFLVSFSGIVTWVISLYTSFYIAGPLYRFARNYELFIEKGPTTPVPTRKTDQLKNEEQQIKQSIVRLQEHYHAVRHAADTALAQLATRENPDAAIAQLKELDRAARL
ncbi:MAG: hypothetical protein AB1513_10740 [Pseudomonadota bacterium]